MNVISAPPGADDLVIVYHAGGGLAFPGAVVASETRQGFARLYDTLGGDGITPLPQAVAEIGEKIGRPGWQPSRIVLAGFSEGCQGVRAQLRAGYIPSAVVAADGTHSSTPPNESQHIAPWRDYAEAAKAGRATMLASCSTIDTTGYESCRATLRRITGLPIDAFGTAQDPAVTRDGNLTVYAVEGSTAPDHVLQGNVLLPRMIGEALAQAAPGTPLVLSGVGASSPGFQLAILIVAAIIAYYVATKVVGDVR